MMDDTDGDVNVEDCLPASVGDKVASQCRAERGGQQRGDAKETHCHAALLWWKFAEEQGDGEREQRRAAQTLQYPEGNQDRQAPGDAAEGRTSRKCCQRDDVKPFDAQRISEERGGWGSD